MLYCEKTSPFPDCTGCVKLGNNNKCIYIVLMLQSASRENNKGNNSV